MPFERHEEFFAVKKEVAIKLVRRDADYGMRDIIQRQRLPDDVRIRAQLVLPELVAENDDGFSVRRLSRRRVEARSPHQRRTDRLEVVRGDEHCRHRPGLDACRSLNRGFARCAGPPGHLNPGIGRAQVHEVRVGPRVSSSPRAEWRRDNLDQALRLHAGGRRPRDS
jgi:hypothetical protein